MTTTEAPRAAREHITHGCGCPTTRCVTAELGDAYQGTVPCTRAAVLAQIDAVAGRQPDPQPLLRLEPWQITRLPGGLHIACSGEAQMDAIVAALGGETP